MPWPGFALPNVWAEKKIIAETGAGQHGVATATAAALFGTVPNLWVREMLNVKRLTFSYGVAWCQVFSVTDGSRVLRTL